MKQPQPAAGQGSSVDASAEPQASDQSNVDRSQYDLLVRQYGEAMQRIGQLEAELDRLTSTPGDAVHNPATNGSSGSPGAGESSGPTDETAPLTIASSLGATSTSHAGPDEVGTTSPSELEGQNAIAQLRVQLVSLAGQLASTKEELGQLKGTHQRSRSRSRRHRTPKWKFWGRGRPH